MDAVHASNWLHDLLHEYMLGWADAMLSNSTSVGEANLGLI